jgi:hypothetical protein
LSWLQRHWHILAILGIILLLVRVRLTNDQDFRLSIGTDDTNGYLSASQIPLASWEFFTSRRPVTLPLFLKLLEPENGYRLDVISRPAADESDYRRVAQQGFDRVVLTQLAFSILGWGALAVAVSRRLENPILKVLAVAFILLFAFSQPVADWDSVIDSSSLTFSLLALSFAIWIEIAFWFPWGYEQSKVKAGVLVGLWLAATILFAFVRDSNQYLLPISAIFLLSLLLLRKMRSKVLPVLILAFTVLAVFGFGLFTARQGMRWQVPLLHAYDYFVFPYEYRMAYFAEVYRMPEPYTPEFEAWYAREAPQAYLRFLVNHPGIVVAELYSNMETFFSENLQPYFHGNKKDIYRLQLERIGNILHPVSSVVFYADLILLGGLCGITWKTRASRPFTWLWLAGWWLVSASLMLFVNYFFDSWGVIRHVVYYIQMYRLFFWIFLLVLIDLLLVYPYPSQGKTVPDLAS